VSFNNSEHHWLLAGWIGFIFSGSFEISSLTLCQEELRCLQCDEY